MEKLQLYKKRVEYLQEMRKIKRTQPTKPDILMKITQVPKKSVVPLDIYQFWHDENLPECLIETTNNIKVNNPEFNYHLYNLETAREFIKDNFDNNVLEAYDNLVPNALKCDLFRYCVMYLRGGIYLDIKYMCINRFKFISLTDSAYLCKDVDYCQGGICNAILICLPNTKFMKMAIDMVVYNVKRQFYGIDGLEPTGPLMLKYIHNSMFQKHSLDDLDLKLMCIYDTNNKRNLFITYKDVPILAYNNKYRNLFTTVHKHWTTYYAEGTIYKNKVISP